MSLIETLYQLQRKIQTLDSSAMAAAPEVDPDLPEELRAAMAAERGQSAAPHRPANSFIPGGPLCTRINLSPALNSSCVCRP